MKKVTIDLKEKNKILVMIILLAIASFLTYYFQAILRTGIMFTHFFYIPIILASLWWKRKGLIVAISLAGLLVLGYIFIRNDIPTYDDMLRAFMFIVISPVVVVFGERIAKSEEQLKKACDELNVRVEERTAQLSKSNAELEQFIHLSAHDLQEPLRMIACYVQMLEKRYKGKLGHEADEMISYAADGAKNMSKKINDLLIYSNLDKHAKTLEPIDCEAVLENVISNLAAAITGSGAKISHDPMPSVLADETQLAQIFRNLIDNAIKFRSAVPPDIHISAEQKGSEWVFSIRDNGIGIDPQFFDRIFNIFPRLHSHGKYPGTGIGLAMCKKIVERHRGRIWVESELGKGSTFHLTIPGGDQAKHE